MRINICMVTYNRLALTRRAVESLLEKTPEDFTLHVVDNASGGGTRECLAALAAARENVRVFFCGACFFALHPSYLIWHRLVATPAKIATDYFFLRSP